MSCRTTDEGLKESCTHRGAVIAIVKATRALEDEFILENLDLVLCPKPPDSLNAPKRLVGPIGYHSLPSPQRVEIQFDLRRELRRQQTDQQHSSKCKHSDPKPSSCSLAKP